MIAPTEHVEDSVCSSTMKGDRCYTISQRWIINDFAGLVASSVPDETVLFSEPFGHQSDPEAKFRMKFVPITNAETGVPGAETEKCFSLYVVLSEQVSSKRKYSKFKLLDIVLQSGMKLDFSQDVGLGLHNAVHSKLRPFQYEDGSLHLHCQITIVKDGEPVVENKVLRSIKPTSLSVDHFKAELVYNLRSYLKAHSLDGGELSDFTIKTTADFKNFRVHKLVLSAQSEVFSRMFQGEFKESGANEMEILDVSAEAVEQFLNFVYDKPVGEEFARLADELLVLGEKYAIAALKGAAESLLIKSLSLDNCCENLMLAELHRAAQLRKASMDFIVEHKREVVKLETWNDLKKTNYLLIAEILETVWG